jgi:hypothetical protein
MAALALSRSPRGAEGKKDAQTLKLPNEANFSHSRGALPDACKRLHDLLNSSSREKRRHLAMSLYYVQKLLYQLNRDAELRQRFVADTEPVLAAYEMTAEEREAIRQADIGLLYVLGVNG